MRSEIIYNFIVFIDHILTFNLYH
ncbi:hypothetical protein KL86PLE_120041 [uncultured Pleomorphomonas sp.]|uniref:Uncharacterized protein n=1 Tax=uncultured Pleomorphomonas sp. TaxID=442121 RepID=A0A212L853_9HYPH|nr:hypothetical protein KL86PLE_120041 [uncultured Pleomorphomonas sp.]